MLAILSVICATAQASPLEGRLLHAGKESESRSNYYTNEFTQTPDAYGEHEEFEGMYLYGMIIGFIVTGIAMIFAVTTILLDEVNRHKRFEADVQNSINTMKSTYECTQQDIDAYLKEYAKKEELRGNKKLAEELERARLAEIN